MSSWYRRLLFMALAMLMPLGLMMPTAGGTQHAFATQQDPTPTSDPTGTDEEQPLEEEAASSPTFTPESDATSSVDGVESATPEVEAPESEDTTPEPEQEAIPTPSETPEEDAVESSAEPFEVRNVAPSAVGDAVDCSYAGEDSGGQYKDTLCWFDFSYISQGGASQPLTTEWVRVSGPNTQSISRSQFLDCPNRTGLLGTRHRRSTLVYQSAMGAEYGTLTFEGCSRSFSAGTAAQESVEQAEGHRNANLSETSGRFYGTLTDYPVEVDLPDSEYTFTAELDVTADAGSSALSLAARPFPTWPGAFLGNTLGGESFYTGVGGNPALYQRDGGGGTTTVTLKNIQMYLNDQPVSNYSVVMADAESTDNGEYIDFSHQNAQGLRWLPNDGSAFEDATTLQARKNALVGSRTCNGTNTQVWNSLAISGNSVRCSGSNANGGDLQKNGTPMVRALAPTNANAEWSVTQQMNGNGLQGVSFGVLTARTGVSVDVEDRVLDAQGEPITSEFAATVQPEGLGGTTATTGSTELSAAANTSLPVPNEGASLSFESLSHANSSSYVESWQCTKTGGAEAEYWPAEDETSETPPAADNAWFTLRPGIYIECGVTYTPPYVTLMKEIQNLETEAEGVASDWDLSMAGTGASAGDLSASAAPASSDDSVRRPIIASADRADSNYELTETWERNTDSWQYGYDWTDFTCDAQDAYSTQVNDAGQVTAATLDVAPGDDVTCTFTNTANEPQLILSKEVFDGDDGTEPVENGAAVDPETTIYYKLTFDNAAGTAPIAIDHTDYLADVLDDAVFHNGSIRISDDTEVGYPDSSMDEPGVEIINNVSEDNPRIEFSGEVPARETRTVWFSVSTVANAEDAESRAEGFSRDADNTQVPNRRGYTLENFLLENGQAIPEQCSDAAVDDGIACTQHPVPAWTVSKGSQPASGARLHRGGNTHYEIAATKMNTATDIEDLVFTDDLTHVFKTAGWAPGAAVPGGALTRGIYFFDESGQSLDRDGQEIGTVAEPEPAYDENSGAVPEPEFDEVTQRWILESAPVTLPDNAMRAELWFAVQAGEIPAGIPGPEAWENDPPQNSGWSYVNYATADASNVSPNQCITPQNPADGPNVDVAPNADNVVDQNFPEACRVQHTLSDNYFTIRKDAAGAGDDLPRGEDWGTDDTGLWNLIGHEFEIRDDIDGEPSQAPSAKLCRTGYNPYNGWDGEFTGAGDPDWGENSETLEAIINYNNEHGTELPLCGLLYAQGTIGDPENPNAGGQEGRWRSEYLTEGDYWLVETQAPDRQVSRDGSQTRPVLGVQKLAEPVAFTIWGDDDGPSFGDQDPQQSMEGRGQLDVVGEGGDRPTQGYLDRCSPGASVGARPVACVNPTGYLMLVKDPISNELPFTGGTGKTLLMIAAATVLLATLAAIWWFRRRKMTEPGS